MRRKQKPKPRIVEEKDAWEFTPAVQRRLRTSSRELKAGKTISLKDFLRHIQTIHHAGAFPLTITRKTLRRLRRQT